MRMVVVVREMRKVMVGEKRKVVVGEIRNVLVVREMMKVWWSGR